MYNYIIGVDDELYDIIEVSVNFHVDPDGMVVDRNSLFKAKRITYRILVEAQPHS